MIGSLNFLNLKFLNESFVLHTCNPYFASIPNSRVALPIELKILISPDGNVTSSWMLYDWC